MSKLKFIVVFFIFWAGCSQMSKRNRPVYENIHKDIKSERTKLTLTYVDSLKLLILDTIKLNTYNIWEHMTFVRYLIANNYIETSKYLWRKKGNEDPSLYSNMNYLSTWGEIYLALENFDSSQYFFKKAYLDFPSVPTEKAHNELWYYYLTSQASTKQDSCEIKIAYLDSFKKAATEYSDSLWIVGLTNADLVDFYNSIAGDCK